MWQREKEKKEWKKEENKCEVTPDPKNISHMCRSISHLLRLDCSLYVSMLWWSVKYLIDKYFCSFCTSPSLHFGTN